MALTTLGFRGEALSSIAAVSKVEMITKQKDSLTGFRVTNSPLFSNGTEEGGLYYEEIGAPDGTTVIVRDLFYNVPVRKKFLKQAPTEASYITEAVEHLALSHPDISFHYIVNGKDRLHTTGNGDLKEILYRIYGKEVTTHLLPLSFAKDDLSIEGFIGHPALNRGNRDYEVLFVNGRVLSSPLICSAIEEGYGTNLMQHRFPFAVLSMTLPPKSLDVNIHPAKKEVRFTDPAFVSQCVTKAVENALHRHEPIQKETLLTAKESADDKKADDAVRTQDILKDSHYEPFEQTPVSPVSAQDLIADMPEIYDANGISPSPAEVKTPEKEISYRQEEMVFTKEHAASFRFLGQLFLTYWLIEWEDRFLIIDQYAAHEKVNYEKLMRTLSENQEGPAPSQQILPAKILTLTAREEAAFAETKEAFLQLGFIVEEMGGGSIALREVPTTLYGADPETLFKDTLQEWMDDRGGKTPTEILQKIADMSCKASVKGGQRLREEEAKALIASMLSLDDPYHCPHGRPTMIELTKHEIERKFKRIV